MPEVEEVFRLATNKVKPDPNALERQHRRQRSAARGSRARAYIAVAAVIALFAAGAYAVLQIVNNGEAIPEQTSSPSPDLSLATDLPAGAQPQVAAIVDRHGHQTATLPGFSSDGYAPSVSADGSAIAYVAAPPGLGYNQAVVMRADGNDPHVVSTPHLIVYTVAISPDGSQLALEAEASGLPDIYVVNTDGSELRQVTTDPATDQYPQWSSDGATIVYDNAGKHEDQADAQFSTTAEIWTVPADGSGAPTRVTHDQTRDSSPSFSPDGTQIAYFHEGEVWTMSADGSHRRHLVWNGEGGFTPRWSPDGKTIAFSYYIPRYRPTVQLGQDLGDRPLCPIGLVDVRTGKVTLLPKVAMATDTNTPQWLDDGHLLIMRVSARDPSRS
jgi:Tol biopolymer transport system component